VGALDCDKIVASISGSASTVLLHFGRFLKGSTGPFTQVQQRKAAERSAQRRVTVLRSIISSRTSFFTTNLPWACHNGVEVLSPVREMNMPQVELWLSDFFDP
jgi:hypothetical protein